ncbi:serine hydrolase domain-containing protein [Bacillus sp. AK128]
MNHNRWDQLEEVILKQMKKEHIAGVCVGISLDGKTIYQKGFGYRDLEKQLPVTPETVFGIASVTKSFTAMAIIQLEAQGFLSIDDPIIKYLPELKINGVDNMETIKIHHLLSHTTGMPPMERREQLNTYHEHIAYINETKIDLLGEPGEYFSYCNDSFLLLGAIIERLTGQLFRRYITSQFLERYNMNRSSFSLEEVHKMDNVSVPYQYNKTSKQLERVDWPSLGTYETGGGIRSNVVDLLKYGQAFVQRSNPSIEQMWKPVYQVGRDLYYGYALNSTPNYAGKYLVVQHGGGQPGVSSNFGFVPEKQLVVTVLTNVGGVSAGEIWHSALHVALGLPVNYKNSTAPVFQSPISELKKFEGQYVSKEGGNILISLVEGKLYALIEDEKVELRPSSADTFVMLETEKPIRFYFNQDGSPWSVFNGSRMLTKV